MRLLVEAEPDGPAQARIFPKSELIWNLTVLDLTPTEVRLLLPVAFGRIEPTAIVFIFARHNSLFTYQTTCTYSEKVSQHTTIKYSERKKIGRRGDSNPRSQADKPNVLTVTLQRLS